MAQLRNIVKALEDQNDADSEEYSQKVMTNLCLHIHGHYPCSFAREAPE